ncbi:ROK family protein [Terrabacter terrigena]|uniref:ROK family protein n=1 Tax=Terrabacter terrigena TaxID=574718 RepID=A0ABW3MY57_9MICO
MSGVLRLGIDIGGTKTAAALVAQDGAVRALRTAASGRGPAGVVDVAVRLAQAVRAEPSSPVVSTGVCMPGLVDPATGLARHAVNLDVEQLALGPELSARLGTPVFVENDVKAAALGAWRLRSPARGSVGGSAAGAVGASPPNTETLAYLNLGTGLASAVVRGGVVVRGIDGVAGEIGHLPIGGHAPCTCGQIGCLETVASGSALGRLWPEARRVHRDPFVAAAGGDSSAAAALEVLCTGIGLAVQLLALASGAERVVVGGGLAALGAPLLEGIRGDLRRRARSSPLVGALDLAHRVELIQSDVPVAAVGAAFLGDSPDVLAGQGRIDDNRIGLVG